MTQIYDVEADTITISTTTDVLLAWVLLGEPLASDLQQCCARQQRGDLTGIIDSVPSDASRAPVSSGPGWRLRSQVRLPPMVSEASGSLSRVRQYAGTRLSAPFSAYQSSTPPPSPSGKI
ncbi:hypothetical protein BaRGS_00016726 [Batillaria attramentaria]|uniref:Uncharacterized protein n=1 Tax=Batillaria attramentaria TaxID=370345 RepID=A0ABD0KXW4_9CAEN